MPKVVNLTSHDITLGEPDHSVTIPPSGSVARVSQRMVRIGSVALSRTVSVPLFEVTLGDVVNMPPPTTDTYYLVSRLVSTLLAGRRDILVPGGSILDDRRYVVGARELHITLPAPGQKGGRR